VSRCGGGGGSHVVNLVSADPTVIAMRDPGYRAVLNRADLNVADGMSIVWAMRLRGVHTHKTAGTDAMRSITRRANGSAYVYGGSHGVAPLVADRLRSAGARLAGWRTPAVGAPGGGEIGDRARRGRASG